MRTHGMTEMLRLLLAGLAVAHAPGVAWGQSQLGEPAVTPGVRLGIQMTPAFPGGDFASAADTGIGGRLRLGSEYMFGRLGVAPGVSVQFLRFHIDTDPGVPKGSWWYVGVLPGVQVAAHLGMAAPFFGIGIGVDHFRPTTDLADTYEANGADRSATGAGFEFVLGSDVWLTSAFGLHFGLQAHPGAVEWEGQSIHFTAFDLGMTAAF